MPESRTVMLAGRAYTIQALPIGQAARWRKKLSQPFEAIGALVEGVEAFDASNLQGLDIAELVKAFSGSVLGSLDLVLELLFDFSPALRADRERIEAEAYDEEAIAAFVEVLKLAFPFGQLKGILTKARA